ncbi:MAG: carbamoyl-phosphate synthase large subunit [Deltaproteobacteria bacterium]|nr:carbamoyl-phosphate synthase large subunit [Deltaproteobacteria bacterium]
MPARKDLKSILLIGSGPIVIGQACEFDYSGVQAVKALKEEGYRVVLVNSNPATIMTDPELADRTYIEPITVEFVAKVIERERPDAILPTIGGQTGLNTALGLAEAGVLEKFNVELIGANVEAIKKAEDRDLFKIAAAKCGLECARSTLVTPADDCLAIAREIGYPIILRPSRTLGGSGGGIAKDEKELEEKLRWAFEQSPNKSVLIEESLIGWKEMELEVMRDHAGNGVIICSIENIDPMGVHTGDSITVAPIQTLTDKEMQNLRSSALRLMNEIGVDTGGSNVQFAVCPRTGRQIVIEMNPRVSRSSALASKATGFPIAKIAAKLAIGYTLDELPNDITKMTPACFEPSIDYVVVKIPRFAFEKFKGADQTLGTQMKSVGEVMAIARTFPEALQKACRSLETGRTGLLGGPESEDDDRRKIRRELEKLSSARLYYVARALEVGLSIDEVHKLTSFDPWFLSEMMKVVDLEKEIRTKKLSTLDLRLLRHAKKLGESDARIAQLLGTAESDIRDLRREAAIHPAFKTVDTCAAEFSSNTPYLYSTYDDASDAEPSSRKKVMILGGGPNRIGQGLEFDYCCVHAVFALRDAGYETIMVNCNPETVSTDYDTADRLYFEPLTLEDVLEIVRRERPDGVIVQYGGQTPLRLAQSLLKAGVPIIGTSPDAIDLAEDREKFRALLDKLGLKQSESGVARTPEEAHAVADAVGFPLLIRPSFVLGGRAMAVLNSHDELEKYVRESVSVSFDRPVLLDRFLECAIEVDVDAVCDGDMVLVGGIMEHVERAGIHSGDSSFMLPSQTLSDHTIDVIEMATHALAYECGVVGLMNVQYAVVGEHVYVLEVNPRASRSVPFVSKVTGIPWAKVAARVMGGEKLTELGESRAYGDILAYQRYRTAIARLPYVAVKESVFPFAKFKGADAVLGPEMRSTGEVMGIDLTMPGAFARAQAACSIPLPTGGTVFLSLRDADKQECVELAGKLHQMGFELTATKGTAKFLEKAGIPARAVKKVREGSPNIVDEIRDGGVTMVINTPEGTGPLLDSKSIRQTAIERGLPLFTTLAAADAAVDAIEKIHQGHDFGVKSVQEFLLTQSV